MIPRPTDLRLALHDVAAEAAAGAHPVAVDRVLARVRRRRAARTAATSAAAVALVGGVAVGATALGPRPAPPTTTSAPTTTEVPEPTPTPTADAGPLPGWVAGPAPCGEPFTATPVESDAMELEGGVQVGTFDPVTAAFTPDPAGATLHVDTWIYPQVPGEPGPAGEATSHTYLVDAAGTVAFWDAPREWTPREATDGSRRSEIAGLYDAVDCRTGRPLQGVYRVLNHVSFVGTADVPGPSVPVEELVELAPVALGVPADGWPQLGELLPRCGEGVNAATVADAPLRAELGPLPTLDVDLAGLDARARVTSTSDDTLSGRWPQSLRAFLVRDGVVVSEPRGAWSLAYPSATTYELVPGESTDLDVFAWFTPCPDEDLVSRPLEPGAYELYVYEVVPGATGDEPGRVVAGGPFPVELD